MTDVFETAARFVAEEPGWAERVLAGHVRREDGSCAGCGSYRPVPWPCILVFIARRARQINAQRDALDLVHHFGAA